jgi:excisionase family DNA binding protein
MHEAISLPCECWHHADLARFWGCSRKTILRLIKRGQLPAVQLGAKTWSITKVDAAVFYATKKGGLSSSGAYARGGRPWGSVKV